MIASLRFSPTMWILSALMVLIASWPAQTMGAGRADVTAEDWQKDLAILVEELEAVHPSPFLRAGEPEFRRQVRALDERLPQMDWEQSFAGMMTILALTGDGHTGIRPHSNPELGLRFFPIRYYMFEEGLFVVRVAPEYQQLNGGRVLRLGNATADEVFAAMAAAVPVDNAYGSLSNVPRALTSAELLKGMGMNDSLDEIEIVVQASDGSETSMRLKSQADRDDAGFVEARADLPGEEPLYLQDDDRPYWFRYLEEPKTVYLKFRTVRNQDDEDFESFCGRMFKFIADNDVERLIIDIRRNGGGNNYLNQPLIHGIIRSDKINQPGRLIVITGRQTYSAAMCAVVDLERQTNAVFVGEPPGASVNHWGDSVTLPLPNTGIEVSISAVFWQNSDPRDVRMWLTPEVETPVRFADYMANQDPAFDAAIHYQAVERTPIREIMLATIEREGLDAAIAEYRALRRESPQVYNFGEYELNWVGYDLVGKGRLGEAIRVFELNVEMFPRAWNPWDSLGETYAKSGNTARAIECYERSVQLNPTNRAGQVELRRLRRES